MGRELQKKKNRSSIQKVRQKPKSKKRILQHPIIAQNWDKTQTLEQNYKRLGLTSRLNKHTGGVERKAEEIRQAREDANAGAGADDSLAIGSKKKAERMEVQEAQVERDPETGKIVRVIESGAAKKANPLNDPLAELDSDEEDDNFNQHASNAATSHASKAAETETVRKLEQEASKPKAKYVAKQTENERVFIVELVQKYGDDYAAMARDMKINYMQRSAGDLKRRVKKWKESGGTLD